MDMTAFLDLAPVFGAVISFFTTLFLLASPFIWRRVLWRERHEVAQAMLDILASMEPEKAQRYLWTRRIRKNGSQSN